MGIKYLTKAEILDALDVKFKDVPVPEWGGTVRIKSLNAARRELWEPELTNPKSDKVRASLVALSCVDENDELIFSIEDVEALCQKSFAAMGRVYDAAVKLNAGSDIEEIEKN